MKVLHVTTSDIGGASVAALRNHRGLSEKGIYSVFLSLYSTFNGKNKLNIYQRIRLSNIISKIKIIILDKLYTSKRKYHFFDKGIYRINSFNELNNKLKQDYDAIIFYWMSTFINPKTLYEINKNKNARLFIYLTDMAPMTGGCHFAWDCKGFENNCGCCPALLSQNPKDLSFKIMQNKKRYLLNTDIKILSPNQLISEKVLKSKLFKKKKMEEVLFGIDKEFFVKKEKLDLRYKYEKSNIINKTVLLFVAANLCEERKGFSFFIDAMNKLYQTLSECERDNIKVIIIGRKYFNMNMKFEVDYYSNVSYPILVDMYNIADYYISTSIEDLGPFTIMESLMCGTPVISFNMGIAPQIIKNGVNGWCVELKNTNELSNVINRAINIKNEEYNILSNNARTLAVDNFEKDTQINKLINVLSMNE